MLHIWLSKIAEGCGATSIQATLHQRSKSRRAAGRLARSKLLARSPHSGWHWPGKKRRYWPEKNARYVAHLEDSRGIPGPRHGDLLDRAKPESVGHCGRAVQLCKAKNVQTFGLTRVAHCRLWGNNLVSNCLPYMLNKLTLPCRQIGSVCTCKC